MDKLHEVNLLQNSKNVQARVRSIKIRLVLGEAITAAENYPARVVTQRRHLINNECPSSKIGGLKVWVTEDWPSQ